MKILLFGKNGQVGWDLNRSLLPLGKLVAPGRDEADFSDTESLRKILRNVKPDIIVNAVAYTAVDKAEEEEGRALVINAEAPGILAEETKKLGAILVHYSTDYVFDGTKKGPYTETDETNPVNAYGRTKLAGEQAIQTAGCDYLIFRTSWVYAARGHNFLLTVLKLAAERDELNIVCDQWGAPTSARLIADTTSLCLQQAIKERILGVFSSGLYHLTASGITSWHGFAEAIINAARTDPGMHLKIKDIYPVPTSGYPTPAARPANSQLDLNRLESVFGIKMPDWRVGVELCMRELGNKLPSNRR